MVMILWTTSPWGPKRAVPRAEALGVGGEGKDDGAQLVLQIEEQEGGEDCSLAPLPCAWLSLLGEGGVTTARTVYADGQKPSA
jgi:hypothetical protein